MNSKISILRCKSYDPALVEESVRKAVGLLGGITAFIRPESRVLVKPNLLMAKEPEFGITTHPEVVRSAIKILKEINCKIFLGDGPSVWGNQIENVDEVYERTGMSKVAQEENVELVKLENRRWRKKFPMAALLDNCDHVLNLAKFKTHDFTLLTGAIKNLFGLVWGTYKTELHKNYFNPQDFAGILVDIYEEVKPSLTIVDAIVAMEGDGPGSAGKLRNDGLLLAGSDCVALDSVLAVLMGIAPFDVLTTREAAKRGLGAADINSISILGESLKAVKGRPFLLPTALVIRKIPQPVIKVIRKLIRYYPVVEDAKCTRCSACIKACPAKCISMKNNRITFDYRRCIACFCCQEVCPAPAIKVKKSLIAKMAGF